MKKRLLFYKLLKYVNHKNALMITGMRQVGKTTLAKQLFNEIGEKKKLWFDLDNPLDQKIFEDLDYNNIYRQLLEMVGKKERRLFVFIDEIQNFPEITKIIKYLIDHYKVKFILTGSSNFYLKNLFPESLSGRKFLFQLSPLSFSEYLYFQDILSLKEIQQGKSGKILKPITIYVYKKRETVYNQYLQFGGFPEVVVTQNKETKLLILKNIFASFFEKDIKILADYADIRELRDLILLLAPRVGSMLDISKIAAELGIDRPKIYRYLEFLQGVFLVRLLPKFSKSIDRRVAGGKKIYFSDTGLLNIIGQLNESQILENAVVNQLLEYGSLCFYNQRNTAEIDVILDKKTALEIKTNGVDRDLQKLKKLSQTLQIPKAFIISKSFVDKPGFLCACGI